MLRHALLVAGSRLLVCCGCIAQYDRVLQLNLRLQIALEWVHQGCESELSADFLHFGTNNFPFRNSFKKCFEIVLLSLWRRKSGFGAAISDAIARSSIVFCNSVCADRIVAAASRLLGAAAACVILLSFAAEDRKWVSGTAASRLLKVKTCQQIFSMVFGAKLKQFPVCKKKYGKKGTHEESSSL